MPGAYSNLPEFLQLLVELQLVVELRDLVIELADFLARLVADRLLAQSYGADLDAFAGFGVQAAVYDRGRQIGYDELAAAGGPIDG